MKSMISYYNDKIKLHEKALKAALIMQDDSEELKQETAISHYKELIKGRTEWMHSNYMII